jgi:hypothetical protein
MCSASANDSCAAEREVRSVNRAVSGPGLKECTAKNGGTYRLWPARRRCTVALPEQQEEQEEEQEQEEQEEEQAAVARRSRCRSRVRLEEFAGWKYCAWKSGKADSVSSAIRSTLLCARAAW